MLSHALIPVSLMDACQAVEAVVRAGPNETAAQALAETLRRAIPGAPVYGCLLQHDDQLRIGVSDETGDPEPRGGKALRDLLKRAAASEAGCLPMARSDKLPGQALALQPLEIAGHRFGLLAVLLARESDDTPALRQPLEFFARHVALHLAWQEADALRRLLEQQLAEETRHGDVGEMVGPALHDVGNFINTVFLTLAVLERKIPAEMRGDFSGLRKQGHALAALAGQVQQARRTVVGPAVAIQMALRDAVAGLLSGDGASPSVADRAPADRAPAELVRVPPGASVVLALPPEELMVPGRADVTRLYRFLLKNAAAAAGPGGRVTVVAERHRGGAVVRIADSGLPLQREQLEHFWDAHDGLSRTGTNALELATCWSLCKRHGGTLQVENDADGGVVVTARLRLNLSP